MKPLSFMFVLAIAAAADEKVGLDAVNRIGNEAFHHSKVMDQAFYVIDVYGPRGERQPRMSWFPTISRRRCARG